MVGDIKIWVLFTTKIATKSPFSDIWVKLPIPENPSQTFYLNKVIDTYSTP